MRISALCLLLSAPLLAQPTSPEDLGSISGQALNAATGEPLRRVSITLMRAEPVPGETAPLTYTGATNAAGQFTMKDIEPGKYRLSAMRNGFVNFSYGARGPMRPGTTLTLSRQQHMSGLTLKLTPHAIITGRILDDEGEPVANARIMLQGYRYINGRKQLIPTGGGGMTNDLGEYRMFGIAPGKYYLSATPMMMTPGFALDRSAAAGPEEDFVATYYPGTIDPAAASQIDVAAGAQLRGMDMALSKTRTVHVKGKVTHGMPGRPNVQLMLTPRNLAGFIGNLRPTPVDTSGHFDIRNVTPGAYILTASVNDGNGYRQGRLPVDVGSSTIDGLNLTVSPGMAVKGQVRSDPDGQPVDLTNVRFILQPREQNMFGGGGQGKPDADGAFEMKNVMPDHFNLMPLGLPSGAYIKSARSDQTDVLASGLDLTSGAPPAPLEIVVSPRAASVTGAVQNPKTGDPAPGVTVVLIPQEKERRDQQSYYKVVISDQHGAFSLTGIPPGEYKAYAWEDNEGSAYMDPDVIKAAEGKGESITLREGDQKTLPLKMIPAN